VTPDEERYSVHGMITGVEGQEISYAEVILSLLRIREPRILASGRANEEGHYHLSSKLPDDVPGRLLLVVEARSDKLDEPLRSAPVEAKPDLEIDLQAAPKDDSELAGLLRAVDPLLDGMKLADIVESSEHHDIAFLAQETSKSNEQIMQLAVAARLQEAYTVPAGAFYAFLRQRVPSSLPASLLDASQNFTLIDPLVQHVAQLIFNLDASVQTRSLQAAVDNKFIGQAFQKQIPDIVASLQSHRQTSALNQPYLAGKTTLGQLLDQAQLPAAKQQAFAKALQENTQTMAKFWATLGDGQHGFTSAEVDSVQQTLELGAFVKNQVPLISALQKAFAAKKYNSVPDLATLTQADWLNLINQSGANAIPGNLTAAGGKSPAEVFAQEIYNRATRAYPTAALASRVTTGTFVPEPQRAPLQQFFVNNPTLDLRRQNIDAYLRQQGSQAFTGISTGDQPAVVANARKFQRVLRIVPHVDTAETLLSLGIHSATSIAMIGKQQFVNKVVAAGLTSLEAYKTFYFASQRYAGLVTLFSQLNLGLVGLNSWPKSLGSSTALNEVIQSAVQQVPSLTTLFGPQDYCEVDDCTSVLSPAAYLTDLLLWLRNRGQTGVYSTALDALLARRPDIQYLLLNCPNTDTPLPYIDVVNELLENAVVALPSGPLPASSYQTTLTAEELRAAPEYVNAAAYGPLASADYPHALPYDGRLDQLRTYLQQSNVALWQQRQSLMSSSDVTVASERFGICPHERDLITHANFVPLSAVWNTPDPVNDLKQVSAFLEAADLTYEQLLELLQVGWVLDGGAPTTIQEADDTCNTATQTLAPLDSDRLDRMHRFLRLWRRTGWKMWELDLLLSAPLVGGNGSLDSNALVALFNFRLLQDMTRLSVDELLSFYQNIDFRTHRDPDGTTTSPLYVSLFQNPAVPPDPALELYSLLAGPVIAFTGGGGSGAQAYATVGSGGAIVGITVTGGGSGYTSVPAVSITQAGGSGATATATLNGGVVVGVVITAGGTGYSSAPSAPPPALNNHATAVRAALQISAVDWPSLEAFTDGTLTLSSLSTLYRIVLLAGSANLSISGLLELGPAPLTSAFASLGATQVFLKRVASVAKSGFSADATNYLLTPGGPLVAFTGGGGSGAQAFATVDATGAVTSITLTAGGSGYTSDPAVIISQTGGSGATATATMAGGAVTAVNLLTGGTGYASAPAGVGVTDSQVTSMVTDVRSAMQKVNDDIYASTNPPLKTLASALGQLSYLSNPALVSDAAALVSGTLPFPSVSFSGGGGSGAQAFAIVDATGAITGITVTNGGSGYTAAPTVAISEPSGNGAAATAAVADGLVSSITVTAPGSGYGPIVAVQISGGGGFGAQATATLNSSGGVAAISVINGGTGYASPPTVTIVQPAGSGATATATISNGAVASVNVGTPGTGYTDRNTFIAAYFGPFIDVATAQASLGPLVSNPNNPQAVQAEVNKRARLVLDALANYLTLTAVIATVASDTQMTNDVATLLMQFLNVPGSVTSLLSALTDPTIIAKTAGTNDYAQDISAANFPNQFLAIRLLAKIGLIVQTLHFVKADLLWLLPNAKVYGGVDLAKLPVLTSQPSQSIDGLLATVLLVQLNRAFNAATSSTVSPPPAIQNLEALISAVQSGGLTANGVPTPLALITGWQQADIQALAAQFSFSTADYLKPATYDRLRTLIAMASATGGSGADLVTWGVEALDETAAAASALQALKSRYTNDAWLQAAPKVMDPLREHRRDALVAYLLANPWKDSHGTPLWGTDPNNLFDFFLIDVEMSACQVTSRVVQAYAAVQLFVQRALMNLEANIVADLTDWADWNWMKRFRLWQANREVFLYPENWLIEADRLNKSEIYEKLEQEVHQQDTTSDNLENATLNYIGRLDDIAHLLVTGCCTDPSTGDIHVVARTRTEPPVFYHRLFSAQNQEWTPWKQIQFDIKAHQVIPVMHRRSLYLFWPQVAVASEPQQKLPALQQTSSPSPSKPPAKHVEITVAFSAYGNNGWGAPGHARGKLYDVPIQLLDPLGVSDSRAMESLYTVKAVASGSELFLDIFRFGNYQQGAGWLALLLRGYLFDTPSLASIFASSGAEHIGRAVFDGRFNQLEMRDLTVVLNEEVQSDYLDYAQQMYGADARPLLLLPENQADNDLNGEPDLVPEAGVLVTNPQGTSGPATVPLTFTAAALEQNAGPLLQTAPVPFRVIGPCTDLQFDPTNYFFYADAKRSYFVESTKYYQYGSQWRPVPPSNPASAPFEMQYLFKRFYHPYTKLFWHEIWAGGLPALYNPMLEAKPDTIDPAHGDTFSFQGTYSPVVGFVHWGEDNEIIDFSTDAAYSGYNWELFFHVPLFLAEQLSQNQQFEDALTFYHFIFDPTRPGPSPAPQRFWIFLPFASLSPAQIIQQQIGQLLKLVNQGDPSAEGQVAQWRANAFNPFLIADGRPVAYMKHVVMSYLDNLIAWGDNLFASFSRENLNQATLLYTLASEILGPQPSPVPPPERADESFNDLLPKLDDFANAMVDVENVLPSTGSGSSGSGGGPLPLPQTFYFKIPPNDKLLGYWSTVADRLFKLRHCMNIEGVTETLALFDAPLDPGLLVAAQAAGIDLGSVLSDVSAPLPNYRYTALYAQAMDFCNAVRDYGAKLLAALEKKDADALALLLPTLQQQLLQQQDAIYQMQVDEAQKQIDALGHALELQQSRASFYGSQNINVPEALALVLEGGAAIQHGLTALSYFIASGAHLVPIFNVGAHGAGGTPAVHAGEGGPNVGKSFDMAAKAVESATRAVERTADTLYRAGQFMHRQDDWNQRAAEANIAIKQINSQTDAATLRWQIAQQQQTVHQTAIDNLQQQIDFLTNKFTNTELYDWMVGKLSDLYFRSYKLAYAMCKRAEHCYNYELCVTDSSFIKFGYWDSLKKGLLAGEALTHDLRRMQASYLDRNARRYEISRIYSLAKLNPLALLALLQNGACDFDIPETIFDMDYPGHYQRQLKRVSLTVVYPSPGKNDNVTCTLTLVQNKVRLTTDLSQGYAEQPLGQDPRFAYQYGAVQRIVMSQAQDDPCLFENNVHYQIVDPRYLPFEGAGAIGSWRLELPAMNEIDVSTVGDVQIHLLYTALDGGDQLKQAAQASLPTTGTKLFSAQNDFSTPGGVPANTAAAWADFTSNTAAQWQNFPNPPTPWQDFLTPPIAGSDQVLTLPIRSSKFPSWTRGKTITVKKLTVYAISWTKSSFILEPQAPLTQSPQADLTMTQVPTAGLPFICSAVVQVPPGTKPGNWAFKLKTNGTSPANDWQSLTSSQIGDVILQIDYSV
jgi:hypothetical protein